MISYRIETVEQKIAETVTCDVCKKIYDWEKDVMEVQEFLHIRGTGGYDSVFGDGFQFEADICQHCLKQKLGDFLRIEGDLPFSEPEDEDKEI